MAERILIKHKGALRSLFTLQGNMTSVGAASEAADLILEEHESPPDEFPETQFVSHMIAIGSEKVDCSLFWKDNGIAKRRRLVPGSVSLSTSSFQSGIYWDGQLKLTVLSIGIEAMERALPEPYSQAPIELIALRAGEPDPILEHLTAGLSAAFERYEVPDRLVVEGIGNAISVYLARQYGYRRCELPTYKGGLSRERLKRVIEYIEANLDCELSILDLSGVAFLSPYHFGKMFKRSLGQSVHQYVTGRRMDRAKALLSLGKLSLPEISLQLGFHNQSHFTTLFRRRVGVTPGDYVRERQGKTKLRIAGS